MKTVILDEQTLTNGDLDLTALESFGTLVRYPLSNSEQIAERIKDADAVLTNKCRITAEIIKQCPNLKYIGLFATGYNNIDVSAATKYGVTVCNAGTYSTDAVAQHTFALILNATNHVAAYDAFVQEGGWQKSETFSPFVFPMRELAGKTLGLIGYGHIGQAVAKIALAFSMRVLVYTRHPGADGAVTFTDLDTLTKESDFISLHCPLNAQSEKMFDEAQFAKCKEGVYFINTARGAAVDEQALVDALKSGKLSGAAIDVLETEPMKKDCLLLNAPNCVITPHVAWAPIETRERLMEIVVDNLRAFVAGTPKNVVNG